MMPLSFIMKENFMERNMTATIFDANAHSVPGIVKCGGWIGTQFAEIKSILIPLFCLDSPLISL